MRGAFHYHIDAFGRGEACAISGWAFHRKSAVRSLHVTVAGRKTGNSRYGLPRPDVGALFDTVGSAAFSGFVIRGMHGDGPLVLTLELADGNTVVEALGRMDGGAFYPETQKFSGQNVVLHSRHGFDFSFIGAILRVCPPKPRILPSLSHPVLLIVPVYGGGQFLGPFFKSLFANTTTPYRLVVVDDGNADPAVMGVLEELRTRGNIAVIRQSRNLGFVEAITAGFTLWRGEHVVLLNTDVVVPPGWLERLIAPLEDDGKIASTTPFSNSGSICGFPSMPEDNPLYLGLDTDVIDGVMRCLDGNALRLPIPTGVGFCMGMSAHALRRIGFIERETFGIGYGEENDWCRKAVNAGFVNVQVPNLFVFHHHGASFSSEQKSRQLERNLAILHERYPDYSAEVAELLMADPLSELREFLAFRLAAQAYPDGAMLIVRWDGADRRISFVIDEARTRGRPLIVVDCEPSKLSWVYTFFRPDGAFRLEGGNPEELRRLRVILGPLEIVVGKCPNDVFSGHVKDTVQGIRDVR